MNRRVVVTVACIVVVLIAGCSGTGGPDPGGVDDLLGLDSNESSDSSQSSADSPTENESDGNNPSDGGDGEPSNAGSQETDRTDDRQQGREQPPDGDQQSNADADVGANADGDTDFASDSSDEPGDPSEPVAIRFRGCDAVELSGEFARAEVDVSFYADDGADSDTYDIRPGDDDGDGPVTVDASMFDGGVNGYRITGVTLLFDGRDEMYERNPNDCEVRPAAPSMDIADVEAVDDGTLEVTVAYENPNDVGLDVNPRVVEGTVDDRFPVDQFEPGEGTFTVTWTPTEPDETLILEADLTRFGHDGILRAETGPADEHLSFEPDRGIEFRGCSDVELRGIWERSEVEVGYYADDGADNDVHEPDPTSDGGPVRLTAEDFGPWAVNGYFITSVTLEFGDGEELNERNPNDCAEEIKPDPPSIAIEDVDRVDDETLEVTVAYENPNDVGLDVNPEVTDGTVDDRYPDAEFEPGEGTFTVLWTPESPDETVAIEADLTRFGHDETISTESGRADEYLDFEGPEEAFIEFSGCDEAEIGGDFEFAEVNVDFYAADGVDSDVEDYNEPAEIGPADFTPAVNGHWVRSIYLGLPDGGELYERNPNDCAEAIRIEPLSMEFTEFDAIDDETLEVTVSYENPNDVALDVNPRVTDGSVADRSPNDEFEPGEGTFTVTWTPESPDETLALVADLGRFGYDDIVIESQNADEYLTFGESDAGSGSGDEGDEDTNDESTETDDEESETNASDGTDTDGDDEPETGTGEDQDDGDDGSDASATAENDEDESDTGDTDSDDDGGATEDEDEVEDDGGDESDGDGESDAVLAPL